MTRNYNNCTRKTLAELARKKGVSGWHGMRKEDLVAALEVLRANAKSEKLHPVHAANGNGKTNGKVAAKGKARRHPVQTAAARNTSASSPEEVVESSKYHAGVV